MLPARFAGLVVLAVTLALAYVWLECRCETVGRELKKLESQITELDKLLRNEEYRWTTMKAPANIEQALARHGIVMTWPRRDQVVRIVRGTDGVAREVSPAMVTTVRRPERVAMNEVALHD